MRNIMLYMLAILMASCSQTTDSSRLTDQVEKEDTLSSGLMKETKATLSAADFKQKVFEIGSKTHFTDTCAFLFECDCCRGELTFNADSTFYYLDYCMSDQVARKGNYTVNGDQLKLVYGPHCVMRNYNYENEVDTSAIDYFMTDTMVTADTVQYTLSMCNGKMKLTDYEHGDIAIEVQSSYQINIEYLKEERFLERWASLKE